jgi:tetratricopeptide (TPR) repeat protein
MSYMVLAQIHAEVDANYPAALDATEKGLVIAPNMAWLHGHLNRIALRQGRISDALRHARTAAQLSPGDSGINRFLGLTLWAAGDLKGAISANASLDNMTAGAYYAIRAAELAMVLLQCAETDRANEMLDNVVRSLNHDTSALGQNTANPRCSLCLALAQAGRTADVRAIKEDLQSEHGSNWFPGRYEMHLAAGEIDEAFDYLRQGIDQRSWEVQLLRTELPFLSPLREDRRWQEVMTHLEDMEARSAAGE